MNPTTNLVWFLVLLVLPIISLALALMISTSAYKEQTRKKYDFLTRFPFELTQRQGFYRVSTKVVFYVFAMTDVFAWAFLLLTFHQYELLNALGIMVLAFAFLKDFFLGYLVTVPADELRVHLIGFVSFASLSLLVDAMAAICFVRMMPFSQPIGLAFAVIVGVIGLTKLFLLWNPRLSHWAKLDSCIDAAGNIEVKRPRPFLLAFGQWIIIGLTFVSTLLSLIGFYLLSLA